MNTEYEDNIICPYCGCEFSDPSDFGLYNDDDETEIECDCGETFSATVNISHSYNSTKKTCEEKNEKCDFELDKLNYMENPYIYKNKNWTIWKCKKCETEKILTGEVSADGLPYVINLSEKQNEYRI